MTAYSNEQIERLLAPMILTGLPEAAYGKLAEYVALLEHWNSRMNLTSVRDRETFVRLHLGECLCCAQRLPTGATTVLDWGSGAGLPGIPIQIARPNLAVTLAESRTRKAAFLREAVRTLGLSRTTVYAGRAEDLPTGVAFDVVTLRAVDRMDQVLKAVLPRMATGGQCCVLTSRAQETSVRRALPTLEWSSEDLPGTRQRVLLQGTCRG